MSDLLKFENKMLSKIVIKFLSFEMCCLMKILLRKGC